MAGTRGKTIVKLFYPYATGLLTYIPQCKAL